jgi:alpha-tubulin suppressor-like RCC1 family protein
VGACSPPGGPYTQVSVGGSHSCAVNAQERVSCWGANTSGQAEVPLGWYTQVSAGEDHTCAVRTSGEIDCWGGDDFGQSTPLEVAP